MKTLSNITLGILCLFITSCATIIEGSRQEVSIHSNPSGASIFINGENKGITPRIIRMKRNLKDRTVALSLDGYQTYEIKTLRKTNTWIIGNIIFGGLIGLAIDAATGAMYYIKPEYIDAQMIKKENK